VIPAVLHAAANSSCLAALSESAFLLVPNQAETLLLSGQEFQVDVRKSAVVSSSPLNLEHTLALETEWAAFAHFRVSKATTSWARSKLSAEVMAHGPSKMSSVLLQIVVSCTSPNLGRQCAQAIDLEIIVNFCVMKVGASLAVVFGNVLLMEHGVDRLLGVAKCIVNHFQLY